MHLLAANRCPSGRVQCIKRGYAFWEDAFRDGLCNMPSRFPQVFSPTRPAHSTHSNIVRLTIRPTNRVEPALSTLVHGIILKNNLGKHPGFIFKIHGLSSVHMATRRLLRIKVCYHISERIDFPHRILLSDYKLA